MSASPTTLALRELAARAAELVGRAGIGAGPVARRIADAIGAIGLRLADRASRLASDLRRGRPYAGPPASDALVEAEWRPDVDQG